MNKIGYRRVRVLFYEFEQIKQTQLQKDTKKSFFYDIFQLIAFFVIAFFLMLVALKIFNFIYPIHSDINTFILQCCIFLLIPIAHIYILRQQRKKYIDELGEEYRPIFLSQINPFRDFLLKKTILFKKFLDTKDIVLTEKEINQCIQYTQEVDRYPNFKFQNIVFKSCFAIFGIWLGAFLQKDSVTEQNLFDSLTDILYFFIFSFIFLFLIDILFKKPTRDFCFILITYKDLFCEK